MTNMEQNDNKAFIIEKIKERPINKKKLVQRSLFTAIMAAMFGLIACLTFLLLQPIISNVLYPEEEQQIITFPEEIDEMSPEEMLSDNKQNLVDFQESLENVEKGNEAVHEQIVANVLSKNGYAQMYSALSDYASELNKSMVAVTGIHSDVDWFNEVQTSRYQTSGVIIANTGGELLILTKYEPLEDADRISLLFQQEQPMQATLRSYDKVSGLAIVTVPVSAFNLTEEKLAQQYPVARLGSSNLKNFVGSPVIALGSPTGLLGSIGYGIITAENTQQNRVDRNYSFWTTDIQGNDNSDGILFNLQGQIVGVITDSLQGSDYKNVVTAYGITELKKTIEKLSNQEAMAYLGITTMNVSTEANREMQVPYGAYVKRVELNAPAMNGGLQIGDIITEIADVPVMNLNDYSRVLFQLVPDKNVPMKIMRQSQNGYKELTLTLTPTENK